MNKQHKVWLSPLLGVLFMAVAVSGLLMFLHLEVPGFKAIHEWGGLIVMVLGILHLVINWKSFAGYFPRKTAVIGAAAGILVLVLAVLIAPDHHDNHSYGYDEPIRWIDTLYG